MTSGEYQRYRMKQMQKDPAVARDAARLRAWRRRNGYTQQEAARLYGANQSNISLAENGKLKIPVPLRAVIGV